MDELGNRIEEAKRAGYFSAQISERSWAAYPADNNVLAVGVGRTERDAWADLFNDLDKGLAYAVVIESISSR